LIVSDTLQGFCHYDAAQSKIIVFLNELLQRCHADQELSGNCPPGAGVRSISTYDWPNTR